MSFEYTNTYVECIENCNVSKDVHGLPAAFGDFDSDELIDMFVIKNFTTVQVMFASDEKPLLRSREQYNCPFDKNITSVVPGNFDGDDFMDVLVTTRDEKTKITEVYILWGEKERLNCSNARKSILKMKGQPLAIDYNNDMIIDLFGTDVHNNRMFWIFNNDRTVNSTKMTTPDKDSKPIQMPHSNAFLDLNNDSLADLVVTTQNMDKSKSANRSLEIWYRQKSGFRYSKDIPIPEFSVVGQTSYLDVASKGEINFVLPVCKDKECRDSHIYVYWNNEWKDMEVSFIDDAGTTWGFAHDSERKYIDTITMRGGDFNLDGYLDLLVTLTSTSGKTRSFVLVNTPTNSKGSFDRTFKVHWNRFDLSYNNSVTAVFYDFYHNGFLDIIFVLRDEGDVYRTAAFKNSDGYDTTFLKVMVISKTTHSSQDIVQPRMKNSHFCGTNLPGASIAYKITTKYGSLRKATVAQLPQSAHNVMNLPFVIFGLGRTHNFVDSLSVGLFNKSREWTSYIIPNSHMVVVTNPLSESSEWKALLVIPYKLVSHCAVALTGICGLITLIIAALYLKERRDDNIQKSQEAHKFHFSAM
ncbi:T-cell immunomodulatory protein isoform X2 [Copidosoma floridanum]|uniref:T-cell immunomodulatory protein isoform X2 n=1 Tax=Copidosoma floridanum TaxID=29053 RepID=UPI0006C94976|nr:T-cell immunomodulatory protein isoform X2 [Copidosoma floridanum]